MKRILRIMFIIFFLSNPVYAADWVWVGDDEHASMFLDKESIQVEPGSRDLPIVLIDCWVKNEYMEPLDDGTKGNMFEFGFKVINNNHAYISIRAYICYDSDGDITTSRYSEKDKWENVPPDSRGEAIYRKVQECMRNQ